MNSCCISVRRDNESSPTLFKKSRPPNKLLFSSSLSAPVHVQAKRGPIFEDGPNFDMAFRLFHLNKSRGFPKKVKVEPELTSLESKVATIGLLGMGDSFGFDAFNEMFNKQESSKDINNLDNDGASRVVHLSGGLDPFTPPAASNNVAVSAGLFDSEWFSNPQKSSASESRDSKTGGNCPDLTADFEDPFYSGLTSSFMSHPVLHKDNLPFVTKTFGWIPGSSFIPSGMVTTCAMAIAANLPLGMWRQHTPTFSPSWFIAALATVPFFIPMLYNLNPVFMPNPLMVFTLGASVLLGQLLGSMAEQYRMAAMAATPPPEASVFGGSGVTPFHIKVAISLRNYQSSLEISSRKISLRGLRKRVLSESIRTTQIASAPQPMLKQVFMAGAMAMAAKLQLGMFGQHTHGGGFSPFPVIAKLCNLVLMPKTTMALNFGACVLGPLIKSMAEQYRMETVAASATPEMAEASVVGVNGSDDQVTGFHIEVSISFGSYLLSLEDSPLESSFLVSQQLASPPAPPL